MEYTLAEIRAFNATMQCGNFTRAAQLLSVSQPAITAQIRKLEARFDGPLLERFSREVRPTELGSRLYRLTCQYKDLEGAIAVLANPQLAPQGVQLRLATSSPLVFMPLIAAFCQFYPQALVKISTVTTTECKRLVSNREVDIGLFPQQQAESGLSRFTYASHRLMAIVKSDHALAQQSVLTINQLDEQPLIFYKPEAFTQQLVQQLFRRNGIKPEAHVRVDGRMDMCEAVSHGLGIGFSFAQDVRVDERFRVIPIAEAQEQILEHVVWLKNRSTLPGIRDFIRLALEHRSHDPSEQERRAEAQLSSY